MRTARVNPPPAATSLTCARPRTNRGSVRYSTRPALSLDCPSIVPNLWSNNSSADPLNRSLSHGGGIAGWTPATSAPNVACVIPDRPDSSLSSLSRSKIMSNAPAGSSSVSMPSVDLLRFLPDSPEPLELGAE